MIKYSVIEMAFDFVSSMEPETNFAVINKKTGEAFYQSDYTDEDEFPEDVDSDDYISIPHKNDLDLGRELVFDFVAQYLPKHMDKVTAIFHSRGAFGRYKDLLESVGKLQDWYKYENERTKQALLEWCERNELEIDTNSENASL